MLITYLRKPNGQIDEQVEISRNVKSNDTKTCNIIMDFKEKKVEKCVVEGQTVTKDWEQLREYFYKVYPEVIEQLEKATG